MKHLISLIAIITCVLACGGFTAQAQRMQNGSYSTVGYIRSDGTVQDRNYTTIGRTQGVSKEWAACFFFFFFK